IEGEVQDMVGFVVGEMNLEEMEVVVNRGDQAGPPRQQEHGPDAAWGQSLDALTQLVMDIGGGDHGDFAFGSGLRGDAVEDSPPSSSQERARALFGLGALASGSRPRENHAHSKPSVAWTNVGLLPPAFLQDLGGFSSFSWALGPGCL